MADAPQVDTRMKAKRLLAEIVDKAYEDAAAAKARGEKIGWCASNFPQEIPHLRIAEARPIGDDYRLPPLERLDDCVEAVTERRVSRHGIIDEDISFHGVFSVSVVLNTPMRRRKRMKGWPTIGTRSMSSSPMPPITSMAAI